MASVAPLLLSKVTWQQLIFGPIVAMVGLVFVLLRRRWLHPLAAIPGPFSASISNVHQCWIYLQGVFFNHPEHEYHLNLHQKYGPVVRVGPETVMINDPLFLPVIYGPRADKSATYESNFGLQSMFSTLKHSDHVLAKRKVVSAYSLSTMRMFETRIDGRIETFLAIVMDVAQQKAPWRHERLRHFSYEVISGIVGNEPIGFPTRHDEVLCYIAERSENVALELLSRSEVLAWFARNTWLGRKLFEARKGDQTMREVCEDWFETHVHGVKPEKPEDGDVMYKIMSAKNVDGTAISDRDVIAESMMAMIAGADTVSDTLREIIFALATHPEALAKLQEEGDRERSLGEEDRIIAFSHASKLPYLNACLRETFRYSPITRVLLPRVSPPGGLSYQGHFIPPGVEVASSPWITMRDRCMYGEDAATYRPERWLDASIETQKLWDRYDFHWGYGSRLCVGRHLALMTLQKVVFELVSRFNFTVTDGSDLCITERGGEALS